VAAMRDRPLTQDENRGSGKDNVDGCSRGIVLPEVPISVSLGVSNIWATKLHFVNLSVEIPIHLTHL